MKQSATIEKLISLSAALNTKAEKLYCLSISDLERRPNPEAWNTLEVFKHLNYYLEFYNPQFQTSLKKAKPLKSDQELKRGYWGRKFVEMMEPGEKSIKKMKTFRSKDPKGLTLDKSVIQGFIELNTETLKILEESKTKDIQKVKCKLTLPLLKLNLGDAFEFIIQHNQRHFLQIENTLPASAIIAS